MKIIKYNEFLDNEETIIKELIKESEFTSSSDLEFIANRKSYKEIIKLGEKVLPFIFESAHLLIWDIALKAITGIDLPDYNSNQRVKFWINWAIKNGYTRRN
jgi:hypothetical protein